jgi:hypothetical protein
MVRVDFVNYWITLRNAEILKIKEKFLVNMKSEVMFGGFIVRK